MGVISEVQELITQAEDLRRAATVKLRDALKPGNKVRLGHGGLSLTVDAEIVHIAGDRPHIYVRNLRTGAVYGVPVSALIDSPAPEPEETPPPPRRSCEQCESKSITPLIICKCSRVICSTCYSNCEECEQ